MGSKRKGPLSYVLDGVILVVILGAVMAFFRINNIDSLESFYQVARNKSVQTKECYESKGKGCITLPNIDSGETTLADGLLTDKDLGYKGPSGGDSFIQDSAKMSKDFVLAALDKATINKPNKVEFKLSDWAYFAPVNEENPCWTTKKEVLARQAIPESLKFKDINHKETKDKSKACTISEGTWIDPYTGDKIKSPDEMTVDHIITVTHANKMGGADWDADKKKSFANDVDNVLLAVSKDSKKARGNKSAKDFSPENKKYKCEFAKNYTIASNKYELSMEEKEKTSLSKLIVECKK